MRITKSESKKSKQRKVIQTIAVERLGTSQEQTILHTDVGMHAALMSVEPQKWPWPGISSFLRQAITLVVWKGHCGFWCYRGPECWWHWLLLRTRTATQGRSLLVTPPGHGKRLGNPALRLQDGMSHGRTIRCIDIVVHASELSVKLWKWFWPRTDSMLRWGLPLAVCRGCHRLGCYTINNGKLEVFYSLLQLTSDIKK